jgi:hypothetical protein
MKGSRTSTRESIRLDAVGIGILVGAVVAFLYIDAIVDVLWIAMGAIVGGVVGDGVKYFVHEARRHRVLGERESAA